MSEFYGAASEQDSINTIHRALDLGVTMLDTADMYGPFTNERLVGRAIKDYRDKVIVATKFGNVRTEDGGFLGVNGKPEYVHQACDASLQRLDDPDPELGHQGTFFLQNARVTDTHPTSTPFLEACTELGYPTTENFSRRHEGAGYFHVNMKDGKRLSAAKAYLFPTVVGCHSQAAVMMIAVRTSDLIQATYK